MSSIIGSLSGRFKISQFFKNCNYYRNTFFTNLIFKKNLLSFKGKETKLYSSFFTVGMRNQQRLFYVDISRNKNLCITYI